jgi:hypothetical protein
MSRSQTSPQCGLTVTHDEGACKLHLTVPEDAATGDRVCIWISQRALRRLRDEIDDTLAAIEIEGVAV